MSPRKEFIEALVDDAMRVCHFDWDWDNESKPEVKYSRDRLREAFKATLLSAIAKNKDRLEKEVK